MTDTPPAPKPADLADTVDPNAVAAGWDPADGPAPFEHGEPVEGLHVGDDLDAAIAAGIASGPSAEGTI